MNNNVAAANQLDRFPSQNKGSRQVAFSDSLPTHRAASGYGNLEHHRSKCCPRIFACCAWICLGVFGIVVVLLILGVIFTSFLQSGLPEISVRMLDMSKFEIKNSTTNENKAILNAKVDMWIEVKNKNDKMELSYSNIVVNLESDDVKLGRSVIPGFSHNPASTTSLNVTMNVVGDSTDKENVLQLQEDRKRVEMDVQVTMEATVGFHVWIFDLKKVPIHVACDFKQFLLLNRINEPPCNIRMFPNLR